MTIVDDILNERKAQDAKWGVDRSYPNGTGPFYKMASVVAQLDCDRAFRINQGTWQHILQEEALEAFAESDPALLRAELVQVAAVAVAWIEAIDRSEIDETND